MKKYIIFLSVIFVLSSVVCAVTGAAIGGRLVRKLYDNRDKLPAFANRIEEAIDGRFDFDGVEDYFDEDDDDGDEKEELYTGEITPELTEQGELRIYAQTGEVKLRTAADGVLRAAYSVRSDKRDLQGDFRLESTDEADISFTHEGLFNPGGLDIELTVYIPSDFGGNVDLKLDAGELSVKEIKLEGLTVRLDAGSVKLKNAEIGVSDIIVSTGELDIDRDFVCGSAFKAAVETGEADIELPFAKSFVLEYNIESGNARLDELLKGGVVLAPGSNGVGGTVSSADATEQSPRFSITVETGSIEF